MTSWWCSAETAHAPSGNKYYKTKTKFALNTLKHCRDKTLSPFRQALHWICLWAIQERFGRKYFKNVLPAWPEDDLNQFWWESDKQVWKGRFLENFKMAGNIYDRKRCHMAIESSWAGSEVIIS